MALEDERIFFSASICCLFVDMFLYGPTVPRYLFPNEGHQITFSEGKLWNTYESQKCEEYISDDADAVTAV